MHALIMSREAEEGRLWARVGSVKNRETQRKKEAREEELRRRRWLNDPKKNSPSGERIYAYKKAKNLLLYLVQLLNLVIVCAVNPPL
jgi:hypothetical protein